MNMIVTLTRGTDGEISWARILRRESGKGLSGTLFREHHYAGVVRTPKGAEFPVRVSSSVLFRSDAPQLFAAWDSTSPTIATLTGFTLELEPTPKVKGGIVEPDEAGF